MNSATPTATTLPPRIRARSIVAGLALATVGAAAAYSITATGLDLTPRNDQHQAGYGDGFADGSVRVLRESITVTVL